MKKRRRKDSLEVQLEGTVSLVEYRKGKKIVTPLDSMLVLKIIRNQIEHAIHEKIARISMYERSR